MHINAHSCRVHTSNHMSTTWSLASRISRGSTKVAWFDLFIYIFNLKQEIEKTKGKKEGKIRLGLLSFALFSSCLACTLENIINQDSFKALQGTSLHCALVRSESSWAWVGAFNFIFISTYLLEVFGLTRFQWALVELYLLCPAMIDFLFFIVCLYV